MRIPSGPIAPRTLARPPAAARQLGGRAVDLLRLVRKAVAVQLQRIRAEGVGLENLGAGAQVVCVHLLHEPGLLQVQLVVADVEEETLGVQHGPHGAIEHMDATILEQLAEGHSHKTPAPREVAQTAKLRSGFKLQAPSL